MSTITLSSIWAFVAFVNAQNYVLQTIYTGASFFDGWFFNTNYDLNLGYVDYVDQATAQSLGMVNITESNVRWGVEHNQVLQPNSNLGRKSIRLETLQSWTHGLFVLDLAHMPPNECGVWPAFWSLGSGQWPLNGEIDIIEFTNTFADNQLTLHTSPGCSVAGADETGTLLTADCNQDDAYTGCGVSAHNGLTNGYSFNSIGGGVYVIEWTADWVKIWFFPRFEIPATIEEAASNGSLAPDVNALGVPVANFAGSCDFDSHLYNHSFIFDVDFCGEWAGNTFTASGCPALNTNAWTACNEYVALNPHAYDEAYWEPNYMHVYTSVNGAPPSSISPLTSVVPAISTSSITTALSGAQGRSSTKSSVQSSTTALFTESSSVLSELSSFSSKSKAASSSASDSVQSEISSASRSVSSVLSSVSSESAAEPSAVTTSTSTVPTPEQSQAIGPFPSSATVPTPTAPNSGLLYTTVTVVRTITVPH